VTLQFAEIAVWKNAQEGAAQLRAIDERSVAELVEQDNVISGDQCRNCAQGCGVSATEAKRSFSPFPFSQRVFQTQMWRLRPADQARSARADAEFLNRSICRFA
jgi:hypothetical protein